MNLYKLLVLILFFWGSFIMTYYLTPVVIQVVKIKRLYEKLSDRGSHTVHVPSFGGVVFFLVFVITLSFAEQFFLTFRAQYLIPAATIMFVVGLKDDMTGISPRNKILAQIIATTILFLSTDFQITDLHGFLGLHQLSQWIVIPSAYVIVIFFINAYNLIDGIDGLAASLGAFFFAAFGILFYQLQDWGFLTFSISMVGMFIAFLRYNLSADKKIFMGDTGSLFIGFILSAFIIVLMSANYAVRIKHLAPPNFGILLIAILFIPVFDSTRIFIARISEGRSPFSADRNHIHHLIMDTYQLTHFQTTARILLLALFMPFILWGLSFWLSHFWLVIALLLKSVALGLWLRSLRRKIKAKALLT
jgi:UDP-N-acetylmuramyl pentapeptide phosphotransferase/UDP-N-acetylglucosamine-1-phosphate transferase